MQFLISSPFLPLASRSFVMRLNECAFHTYADMESDRVQVTISEKGNKSNSLQAISQFRVKNQIKLLLGFSRNRICLNCVILDQTDG